MNETHGLPRPKCRTLLGVRILSTGSYVPEDVVDNEHLRHRFGRNPDWIVKQTGIRERRHCPPHLATSDLAYEAARNCLAQASVDSRDVDLLLVATVTPDMTFPSVACQLQDRLNLRCAAVDLGAACAGFVYSLVTGAAYISSGASDVALIVGADCLSRIVNPKDVKTYPLMGDGAGAVLLTRGAPRQGIVRYSMGSHGQGAPMLRRRGCGSRLPPTPEVLEQGLQYLEMDGRGVFNWAASILSDTIQDVLHAAEMSPRDVDLYVPHQANIRIINAAIDVLGIDRDRVWTNIDKYGNTSAASVPLALDEAVRAGRIQEGQHIVLTGFGAGLVWGTALMRW